MSVPEPRPCSIASALDVIGERWTLLVLREIHYGVRRFDDIVRNTGASRDTVTKRLKVLVAEGVVSRRQYSSTPPRYEYDPTPAGLELKPLLLLLNDWGRRWRPDSPQTSERFVHDCGHEVEPIVTCGHCERTITGPDVATVETASPHRLAS